MCLVFVSQACFCYCDSGIFLSKGRICMTEFFADLHIHSRFSRATSKGLTVPALDAWAQVKGIHVMGTGDFTHPVWRQELSEQLYYDEESGLYASREPVDVRAHTQVPFPPAPSPVRFMLQGEVSTIYERHGRKRKIHSLIFMPHIKAAHSFCKRLSSLGSLTVDGRPTFKADVRHVLEMVLETDPRAFLIPAHIWTPWFSVLGSKSGFNSIEECFGDLSEHIFALETGLSSSPAMNRRLSQLDGMRLISNSDAHSPEKIGREVNRFAGALHYDGILGALREPHKEQHTTFLGTVEFYPEEGKYFGDGHRKCGVSLTPEETRALEGKCPVCGKKVTVGVLNRVLELADRAEPVYPDTTTSQTLVPLAEILAEIYGQGVKTRKVQDAYVRAVARFGSELSILLKADPAELNRFLNPLGEAVERVRAGAVSVVAGYDGLFGTVRLFTDEERGTITREVGESPRGTKAQDQGLRLLGEDKTPCPHDEKNTFSEEKEGAPQRGVETQTQTAEPSVPSADGSEKAIAESEVMVNASGRSHKGNVLDDASVDFIFSDVDDESMPELLPFLPLENVPPKPVQVEKTLNLEQRTAAFVDTEPTLLMAGAGTGKTHSLFARICHLLKQGTVPRSLLVITFTRKIATEIDKKLLDVFGEGTKLPTIDTLSALALDLWHKTHGDVPVLLSDESARQVFAEANIEEEPSTVAEAWEAISLARKLLQPVPEAFVAFGSRYVAHKSAWNLADYTDLLEFWLEQAKSGIFKPLWDYVLVDEVQELSPLARELMCALLPSSGRGFFGVGDREQALYTVAGDKDDIVEALQKVWPDLQVLSLMTGHRSRLGILEVSQSIAHGVKENPRQASFAKDDVNGLKGEERTKDSAQCGEDSQSVENMQTETLSEATLSSETSQEMLSETSAEASSEALSGTSSENPSASLFIQATARSVQQTAASIHLFKAPTGETEVQWITDKIAVLLGGVTSMADYDAPDSDVFIPARVYKPGEIAILLRDKDLGHEIHRSLARIGIGVAEPQTDVFWADERVRILLQLGCRMLGISLMEHEDSDIPHCPDKVLAKGPLAMSAFLSTVPPFDALFWHSRAFRELVRVFEQSGGWAGLMTWIHLQHDLELVQPQSAKVQIMTLHAAKGLEFPVVFLPCLEEGILPSAGPLLSGRFAKTVDVEAERRLFSMGVARAKEALFMSYSSRRSLRGADVRLKMSRFLEHLPESFVTVSTLVSKTQHQEEQLNLL